MYIQKNNCWYCQWNKQGKGSMHCSHPKAIVYKEILNDKCTHCGRLKGVEKGGCGVCIGRGSYTYHSIYNDCDINEFKARKK